LYGKIFKEIFYGSLMMNEGWLGVYVMMSLVTLAEDEEGILRYDDRALYRLLGLENSETTFDHFLDVMVKLNEPDPLSNLRDQEGRRIIPLSDMDNIEGDRGYFIVNYAYYRRKGSREDRTEKATARKQRQREREKLNKSTMSRSVTHSSEKIAQAEAQADTDTEALKDTVPTVQVEQSKIVHCPHEKIIDLYHQLLPMCPRVRVWTNTRRRYLQARWKEYPDIGYFQTFFTKVSKSKFLTGKTNGSGERPPFVASLEWLIRPNNFAKVLEDRYG